MGWEDDSTVLLHLAGTKASHPLWRERGHRVCALTRPASSLAPSGAPGCPPLARLSVGIRIGPRPNPKPKQHFRLAGKGSPARTVLQGRDLGVSFCEMDLGKVFL